MKIIIGADMVPTVSNEKLFTDGNIETLFGKELLRIMKSADYRIFNLETPLTDKLTPIKKNGPHLSARTSTIQAFKELGCDLLTIANNHILDQNEQGLQSTIDTLKKAEIAYVGAGESLKDAAKPYIFKIDNKKIGVYACAEHEFSIATEDSGGANPFDVLDSFDHVATLKSQCDYVIVLYHGGKEYYRYPSPNLQKCCRKFVEKGANIVICQHSHCVGCHEDYMDGTIVYGQGNFIFDHGDDEYWNSSLLITINDDYSIEYITLSKKGNLVRLADEKEKILILKGFDDRSNEIKTKGFVEEYYHSFSKKMLFLYYQRCLGSIRYTFLFKMLNKLSGQKIITKCYPELRALSVLNSIDCEAHRELFIDGIKGQINGR